MRILLVGGTSALAQVLRPILAQFSEVITAGRKDCDFELDLTWPSEKISLPKNTDIVINTAAHFGGDSFDAICASEMINAMGALKLCNASAKVRAKHFIHVSSINTLLDNTSEYFGAYALSKKHADDLVQFYCEKVNLPYVILRPSQIYGDQDEFKKHQFFLYDCINKALRNEDVIIYGNRNPLRNYFHIEDLCKLISAVVTEGIEGIYSCTNPKDSSILEIANVAIRVAGASSCVIFNGEKNDISDNVFAYDDTLYKMTGIYPEIDIEEGITRLVLSKMSGL